MKSAVLSAQLEGLSRSELIELAGKDLQEIANQSDTLQAVLGNNLVPTYMGQILLAAATADGNTDEAELKLYREFCAALRIPEDSGSNLRTFAEVSEITLLGLMAKFQELIFKLLKLAKAETCYELFCRLLACFLMITGPLTQGEKEFLEIFLDKD